MPDVTEPDEGDLEEFEAAMMLADALASLAVLADAGASRRELRQAITAAIDDLPETAAWLVGVAVGRRSSSPGHYRAPGPAAA